MQGVVASHGSPLDHGGLSLRSLDYRGMVGQGPPSPTVGARSELPRLLCGAGFDRQTQAYAVHPGAKSAQAWIAAARQHSV